MSWPCCIQSLEPHRAWVDDVVEVVENGRGHLGQKHDLTNMGGENDVRGNVKSRALATSRRETSDERGETTLDREGFLVVFVDN